MEDRPIKQKRGRKRIFTKEELRVKWNDYQRAYYARKSNKYEQFKDIKLTDIKLILNDNKRIEIEINKIRNENKKN